MALLARDRFQDEPAALIAMRILSVVSNLGPGGTQRVAQNFAVGFARQGHDSAGLAYGGGGMRAGKLSAQAIPTFIADAGPASRPDAIDAAANWGPDLVHVHRTGDADPVSAGVIEALLQRSNTRLPICETNIFGKPDYSAGRLLVDVHLQLTEWAFWKWLQWTRGLEPQPVGALMPNLIDTQAFAPASQDARLAFRVQHGIPADAVVFGRIGQPIVHKWDPVIVDAFARHARRHADAWLLLVGAPDSILARARALPGELRTRLAVIPFLDDDVSLCRAFSAMDVFLHAARIGESFGMVLAESLLCGTPVISLATPLRDNGQVELVGHERGGRIVRKLAGMGDAMALLHHDGGRRAALADAGAAFVRERYAIDKVVPEALRLFEVVRQTAGRDELREALRANRFTVAIPTPRVRALLRAALDTPPPLIWPLVRLVHLPWLYRLRQAYRLRRATHAS